MPWWRYVSVELFGKKRWLKIKLIRKEIASQCVLHPMIVKVNSTKPTTFHVSAQIKNRHPAGHVASYPTLPKSMEIGRVTWMNENKGKQWEKEMDKSSTFNFFPPLNKKDIPQTALGKCFYKPPIMPCTVIRIRNKIHTVPFFFYIQKKKRNYF